MSIRSTQSVIYSEEFARSVIAAYKTVPVAALAAALKCRLIKQEGFAPNPMRPLADYTAVQADYTDYAEAAVVLVEPANVGPDTEGAISTVNFVMSTDPAVVQNTVHGYYLVSGAIVVMAEMFATGQSVGMTAPGDFLTINLALPFMDFQGLSS